MIGQAQQRKRPKKVFLLFEAAGIWEVVLFWRFLQYFPTGDRESVPNKSYGPKRDPLRKTKGPKISEVTSLLSSTAEPIDRTSVLAAARKFQQI